MITTEYIGFTESLLSSVLGLGIVFLSLVFLAIFVTVVSKVISILEKNVTLQTTAAPAAVVSAKPAAGADAVRVAVIAAAITEERREPPDAFVITNIKKL